MMSELSDPIPELGKYMLHGWVLMGDTCPSCPSIPLVFNRKDQLYLCVQCRREHYSSERLSQGIRPSIPSTSIKESSSTSSSSLSIKEEENTTTTTTTILETLLEEIQWTITSLKSSCSISEKLLLIDLLEREHRVYQSFLFTHEKKSSSS